MPAGQGVQEGALAREYVPAGHRDAVALVDPGGQAYPAAQLPEQAAEKRLLWAPKVPPGHSPLHMASVRPNVEP